MQRLRLSIATKARPKRRALLATLLALAFAPFQAAAREAGSTTAVFKDFRYAGHAPGTGVAVPGTYLNPIISGSYSDPAIVRVGRDYYLSNASFTLFPGGPILHSRDLVHWRQIGAAISRAGQLSFKGLDTWQGNYANDLKHHDGVFYFMSACQGCGGPFLMTARNPAGPWSDPVFLPIEGIDTSIFFDDDGRAYVVITGPPPGGSKWPGHRALWMQELDLHGLKLVGERTVLVDGGDDPGGKPYWLEGPHLLKHDGRYVLIAAQGGTNQAHTEVAFRADRLRGPYTPDPDDPILSQNGLDPGRVSPVSQTGHADLVQTPQGAWWAVFLGSRPWGRDDLDYDTGRETFLLPASWRQGWPAILPPGSAVPLRAPAPLARSVASGEPHSGDFTLRETFASAALPLAWVSLGAPEGGWWRSGGGELELQARPAALGGEAQPSLLAIRQQHPDFRAQITVAHSPTRSGALAGLAAYQGRRRWLAVAVAALPDGGREARLLSVTATQDPAAGVLVARAHLPPRGAVRLRVAARGRDYAFGYAIAGQRWRGLGGRQDGAPLSARGSRGFTGVLVGPFAYAPADGVAP